MLYCAVEGGGCAILSEVVQSLPEVVQSLPILQEDSCDMNVTLERCGARKGWVQEVSLECWHSHLLLRCLRPDCFLISGHCSHLQCVHCLASFNWCGV